MFELIIQYLGSKGVAIPNVFNYLSTRMILSALTSLIFCLFVGPFFIRKLCEFKIGQQIRREPGALLTELHEKKHQTPTMGGILMLLGLVLSIVLWMDFSSAFTWILLFATLSLGSLGAVDDYLKLKRKNSKGLSGKKKLAVQLVIGGVIALFLYVPAISDFFPITLPHAKDVSLSGSVTLNFEQLMSRYYIPFYKSPLFVVSGAGVIAAAAITLFVITGSSNAVNLTDGLDGLAAGLLVFTSGVLAIFAFFSNHIVMARYLNILYIEGSADIAIFLSSLFGVCLGFLWFNGHPAEVFMGDTGSLSLGGLIGVTSILMRREFLLALVGGVFVVEALSVILQVMSFRLRHGKRIFLCSPIHHHFEYKGWPETKVVLRFWIVGLILAAIGLASLKFQ